MKKFIEKIPKIHLSYIVCVIVACLLIFAISLRINATSIGEGVGSGTGSLVGNVVGFFQGVTDGRIKGTEAGKEAGLSAEDTTAEIANQIHQVENLEVLVASVKLSDFHQIGEDNPTYAALYIVKANVVFSVDMSLSDIKAHEDGLHITLPKPVSTLYIDNSSIEKAAEYQKTLFNGSAETGFEAYLNSMKKIQEASEDTLDNYDVLVTSAKKAAEKQVHLLAESVSIVYDNIFIDWIE